MLKQERLEAIIKVLVSSNKPVSATSLAKQFYVSRQVIVQDISLLRAKEFPILATARGYVMPSETRFQRVMEVRHTDQQIEDELQMIVDLGGDVLDVFVKHQSYGVLSVDISIKSRLDIQRFLKELKGGKSKPLKNLTSEHHYHTIQAESNEILDVIEEELKRKGYLITNKG